MLVDMQPYAPKVMMGLKNLKYDISVGRLLVI